MIRGTRTGRYTGSKSHSEELDRFESLRREAYERGRRDCVRSWEAREEGEELFKNNPHQNNFATDEREAWEEGWADEFRELQNPIESYGGSD